MDTKGDADAVEILCPECDYNLYALTSNRCPWCGWEIDTEVLIEEARTDPTARRISAGVAGLVVGWLTVAAVGALVARASRLTVFDVIAVVGVGLAALGNIVLGMNVLWGGRRFPLRRSLSADLLLIVACLSLVAGIVGAIGVWEVAPTDRVVRGVRVNGVFEFVVTAGAYVLPGALLLGLRAVSYSYTARPASRAAAGPRMAADRDSRLTAPFSIDVAESYTHDQIVQSWTQNPRPTSPTVERLIEQAWETHTALAEATGAPLYNGPLVRAAAVTTKEGRLLLDLSPTCFRDLLGTNLSNARFVAEEDTRYLANALGASAVIMTSDGFLALGRRNDSVVFHSGYLHLFGRLIEPPDRGPLGKYDPFQAVVRELREELFVTRDEVLKLFVIAVVRDRAILQPELLFDAELAVPKSELIERFNATSEDREHSAIEFVHDDPDAILPFLRRVAPVTPVAEAGLLIHGRNSWGEDWYDQTCLLLYGEVPSPRLFQSVFNKTLSEPRP